MSLSRIGLRGWRHLRRRLRFWWGFQRWRLSRPGSRFADFYVDRMVGRLARPGSHVNLGNVSAEPERAKAFAAEVLRQLRAMGMQPTHRLVDYGCGSLHVGETLIEYLEPGGYCGLDVTDVFFRDATTRFDRDWLDRKRPRLETIRPAVVAELQARPADFLICTHVIILVPPRGLNELAGKLASLIGPPTRGLIELELHTRPQQVTETFFWHTWDMVERAFAAHGIGLRRLGTLPPLRPAQRDSVLVEASRATVRDP